MQLLKNFCFAGGRNLSVCVALAAACALPAQAIASTRAMVSPTGSTVAVGEATTASVVAADAPKGILASGQIHKRTTPAISLANEPELPFFFKSWVFALLTVLIVIAVKRPWNTAKGKSAVRRANAANGVNGLIALYAIGVFTGDVINKQILRDNNIAFHTNHFGDVRYFT